MELLLISKIILIFFSLSLVAFFSGAQTALFALGHTKLEELISAHHPRAPLVQELLDKPRRLYLATLVGSLFFTIAFAVCSTSLCISFIGTRGGWIAFLIMVPLIIFIGEVLPRTFALSHSEQCSLLVAKPLAEFIRALLPVRWIIKKLLNLLVKPFGNQNDSGEMILHEEPLSEFPQEDLNQETMPQAKKDMVHKILAFSDTVVSNIMTPRSRMFTLSSDLDMEQLLREVKQNHFSRIPVYKQEKNTFIGILYAKDLLALTPGKTMPSAIGESLLRPPYFVPHDKKIPDLLKEFQDKQIHLALVVNENGTVNGLVTMEDLLEELFGEIYDEFDH